MSDSAPQGRARLWFRATQRVRHNSEFVAARESGRRYDAGWFLLWARPRGDTAPARLGVSASRAVGGAVVRNRAKRWLREAFRLHQHEVPAGYDLVISARAALRRAEFGALENRLLNIFRKLAGPPSV